MIEFKPGWELGRVSRIIARQIASIGSVVLARCDLGFSGLCELLDSHAVCDSWERSNGSRSDREDRQRRQPVGWAF